VLVVGAGPAGLACALGLARHGLRGQVVDQASRRPAGTRCSVLWPSTLDALALLGGSVGELARQGVPVRRKVFHLGDDSFGHSLAEPDAWWPLPLSLSQDVTEQVLLADVARVGVPVRYQQRAVEARDTAHGVSVAIDGDGGERRIHARWLVLATGAPSPGSANTVLPNTVLPNMGRTSADYPGLRVLQADGRLRGDAVPPQEEHIFLAKGRHAGFVPLPDGRCRVFLAVPPADARRAPDPAGVGVLLNEITRLRFDLDDRGRPWCVVPREDVATVLRVGRRFLVGEAAKVVPLPVHGLNSGIQDALNLAWKLAAARPGADEELLDTYHEERHAAALATLEHTRRALGYGSAADVEGTLLPRIRERKHDVRTGPAAGYQSSAISADLRGPDGGPRAGQHMPDIVLRLSDGRNILVADTVRGGWTLLAVGADVPPEHTATINAVAVAAPLPSGLYLIRPDGYLGFTGGPADGKALAAYCRRYVAPPGQAAATSYIS
jgi:NADPH-dependent dioxygenase